MKPSRRSVESAAFYATAFLITVVLHEWAHGIVDWLLGGHPVVHTGYVEHFGERGGLLQIAHTLAGPFFSLAQGLIVALLVSKLRAPTRLRLFLLWLAYHGVVNFVGNVFTIAFAPAGDMGKVFGLIGAPWWVKVGMTGLGFVGLRTLVRPMAGLFADLCPHPLDSEQRATEWSWEIGLWAGFLATPVVVVAALPVPAWIALVYNLAAALPLFDLPRALVKARARAASTPLPAPSPWLPVVAYLLLVVVVRLVMDPGVGLDAGG